MPMRFESFEEILAYYSAHTPAACALIYDDGAALRRCSYGALYSAVHARAAQLAAGGKTSLAILADGSFECVVEIFAANIAGLQIAMLDAAAEPSALSALIKYTDADCVWGDAEASAALAPALTAGVADGRDRLLFFTSGTMSASKAVALTGHSLCQSAYNGGAMLPLRAEDVLMCMLPLGHVFGFVCGLLWGLSCGCAVALGRGARHYVDDLAHFRPTALSAVPSLLRMLVGLSLLNDELALVLVGAGDCPRELIAAVQAQGRRVCFGYGLTETSSGVAISVRDDPFEMEVCPDDELRIAPDGEIIIRAPGCMMQGYYKCPEDTRRVLRDGELYTGDLGRIEANGRLRIIGRKKEILVLADGTKLFLPEYEAALLAAVGEGELAAALKNGRPCLIYHGALDEDELWRRLSPLMARYPRAQQLAHIVRAASPLPRTAAGKLMRWQLAALVE